MQNTRETRYAAVAEINSSMRITSNK